MRIIGGSLKGKSIMPPVGYKARPTTDFAKEGLFNILQNEYEFEGLSILDLFSGTGSISFEFASRGASEVISIEMNPANASFIKRSAASLGLTKVVQVVHHNAFEFVTICRKDFDIVFADPPYAIEGLDTIPDKVLGGNEFLPDGLVRKDGYLILEHPDDYSFKEHPLFVKEKKYGNVHFSFFIKK